METEQPATIGVQSTGSKSKGGSSEIRKYTTDCRLRKFSVSGIGQSHSSSAVVSIRLFR